MFKLLKFWILICVMLFGSGVYLVQSLVAINLKLASVVAENLSLRKDISTVRAKTKMRTKAKARMRRILVALPFVGLGLVAYFEKQDYNEWKEENPEGTLKIYGCEMASISAEIANEVLNSLPERLAKKIPDDVMATLVPECELAG